MDSQANVTAIDALDTFRGHLVQFLTAARGRLDEARDSVRRTRQWIQHDQRLHWENQVRVRKKALESAELELFSARLSGMREAHVRQEELVRRMKRALAEAEEKLRHVKKWSREFEERADPLLKRLQRLRDLLDDDLPKGIAWLSEAQRILDDYTDRLAPPTETSPAPPPAE